MHRPRRRVTLPSRPRVGGRQEIRSRLLLLLLLLTLGPWARIGVLADERLPAGTPNTASGPAFSDFNGDGITDMAMGAPSEDLGAALDGGAVNVLYGSTAGLQTGTPENQFWTQDSPDLEDEAEWGDRFGWSLAVGDFDADGFADLAIGASSEDLSNARDAGAVHVLYGSTLGLQVTLPEDQLWTQDSPDVEGDVGPEERFGRSLTTGDFNDDGFADLAVGVPFEPIGIHTNVGAVNVLFGSASGLQATAPEDQYWSQDSPEVEEGADGQDRFGWILGANDFNGDGYADLAIGAPLESINGLAKSTGAVNVLYGSPVGLQTDSPEDQLWTQDSPDVEDQSETKDRMGWFLTTGEFNGDGYADIAIGVPFEDLTLRGAGAVNVLYGSASGLQIASPEDQFWNQDSPDVQDEVETRDWFGWALAAGDYNFDGFDDLAIGVRTEDVGLMFNAGAADVLYGSPTGLQAGLPAGGTDDQFWTQDSPGVEDQAEIEDEFGWALEAADFNGDRFADLAIGVPLEDLDTIPDSGAAHILYGSPAGLQTDSPAAQFWTQDSPDVKDQAEEGDEFGDSFVGGAQCDHPCHAPFPIDHLQRPAASRSEM